jgi:ATP-dependent protease ClpP protease subunit
MKLSFALYFFGFLTSCFAAAPPIFNIVVSGSDILYIGTINEKGATELIELMRELKSKRLFISSGGGSSEAGMIIGNYISKNSISVIVVGQCYSSCANYIFLPSKDRYKLVDSKIGMHGGAQSYEVVRNELLKEIPNDLKQYYSKAIELEREKLDSEIKLLKNSGVAPEIIIHSAEMTLYGSAEFKYKLEDGTERRYFLPAKRMSSYELWFPSEEDYKKWGLVINNYSANAIPGKFKKHINKIHHHLDDFIKIGG